MASDPASGTPRVEVFRAPDRRRLVLFGVAAVVAVALELVVAWTAGWPGSGIGGLILLGGLGGLARRLRGVGVVVAWVTVTVRNPFRTVHVGRADAFWLGVDPGSKRLVWTRQRYLSLVVSPAVGPTRTIRLWGVGPTEQEALAAALGLTLAEPHSNVRIIASENASD